MNPKIKGTKPISQRKGPGASKFSFSPRNALDIPEEVQKELQAQDLEWRWLDATQMAKNMNLHRMRWEIYKRKPQSDGGVSSVPVSPDGTIRSGTCILGVRPIETGDGHRAFNEEKRRAQNQAVKASGKAFRNDGLSKELDAREDVDVSQETVVFEENE